jgi:hypothetical protein
MNRKIILFDVDGTLLDCVHGIDYIRENTQNILHKLKKAGHYIFIASGRPYSYMLDELLQFDFDGYILNDGAQIIINDQEIVNHAMNKESLLQMYNEVKNVNGTFIAYTKEKAYFYNGNKELLDYIKSFRFNDKTMINKDNLEDIFDNTMKIHIETDKRIHIDENEFYISQDYKLPLKEIYSKKYTKATALKEVLDILNIDINDSYFFGDGFNDIEMMDYVGHSIAMDNAHDDVKKHAEFICKSVEEEGIVDFVENSNIFF